MQLKFTPPSDGGGRSRTFRRAPFPEPRSDVVFDYDQRTSAEDLVPVLQSLSGSASTPHYPLPMASGMETITTGHF